MSDKRHDHDTDAILRRRRFLITSALTGAGLGALLAGCEPEVCLSVEPPPKPKTGADVCLAPKPRADKPATDAGPQACLSVPFEKPQSKAVPEPCLSPPVEPRPCLSPPAPKPPPQPKPCLSMRERK